MIDLSYSNGTVLVWNAEDVYKLRREYRIVGNLIGCLASLPRQDQMLGLPLQLSKEEVHLLLTKKFARLIHYKELEEPVKDEAQQKWRELLKESYLEQSILYREERIRQLMKISDKIVQGKKKKYGPENFDEQAALQEEIDKIPTMSEDSMIIQLLTRPHWKLDGEDLPCEPSSLNNSLKNLIFMDLWGKGYYLTSGEKFGGDFLVYPGDPLRFHSHFIAVCIHENQVLTPQFIVSKGRLGTNVKKTVLMCSINSLGEIIYQSLQWLG